MATHSGVLAWRIPRTEEPSRLHSVGWRRAGQERSNGTHSQALVLKLQFGEQPPGGSTSSAPPWLVMRSLRERRVLSCGETAATADTPGLLSHFFFSITLRRLVPNKSRFLRVFSAAVSVL